MLNFGIVFYGLYAALVFSLVATTLSSRWWLVLTVVLIPFLLGPR